MRIDHLSVKDLLTSIGAQSPTPGGGAVASVTAALGAALAQMVVRYSQGKKKLAAHDALHREALRSLESLAAAAMDHAEADAVAYGRLNRLFKLDKEDERRKAEWPDAVAGAIAAPRRVLDDALEILRMLARLSGRTNTMLDSDLAIAAILADAAARAAAWNIRVNLPLLSPVRDARTMRTAMNRDLREAKKLLREIEQHCLTEDS